MPTRTVPTLDDLYEFIEVYGRFAHEFAPGIDGPEAVLKIRDQANNLSPRSDISEVAQLFLSLVHLAYLRQKKERRCEDFVSECGRQAYIRMRHD